MTRESYIPDEKKLLASLKIRNLKVPKSPLWEAIHPNPGIRRVQRSLAGFAKEADGHARANLFKMTGELTGRQSLRINACALCLVYSDKSLTTVAMHNFNRIGKRRIRAEEQSIVSEVLRSEREYYCPDISLDKHYLKELHSTRSQFTLPMFWKDELIAILTLESADIDGFTTKAREYIRSICASLTPDLLVLKSLKAKDNSWCPWHPDIHGWDFATHLERMCREVATRICPTTVKMAVWYPDYQKDELRVLGTYGYDWNYVSESSLRMSGSQIGQAVLRNEYKVQKLDIDKFVQNRRARIAGIKEAYAINIQGTKPNSRPYGVITCYLTGHPLSPTRVDSNVRGLALQAIEYCAFLCSHLIHSYTEQKRAMACAKMEQAMAEHRRFPRSTRFEVAATVIRKVLRASMQSTFVHNQESNELRCVQSTGFCLEKKGKLTRSLNRKNHSYSVAGDKQSHTVQCFVLKKGLRRTLVGNLQEKGLPGNKEFVTNSRNAEFDPDETIKRYHNSDRSLMCAPLFKDDQCIGVMRVVRGGYERAFGHLDAKILSELAVYLPLPQNIEPRRIGGHTPGIIAGVIENDYGDATSVT